MENLLSTHSVLTLLLLLVLLSFPGHTMVSQASDIPADKIEGNTFYSVDAFSKRVKRAANLKVRRGIRTRPYSTAEQQELLKKHNDLRGLTNASNMLMVDWDSDLEKEAQRWADRCDFNHPTQRRQVGRFKSIGQNLYVSTHEPSKAGDPLQSWYDEIKDYTYSNNFKCVPNKMCGHYTQMIWATNEAMGCAIKYCPRLTSVDTFNKGYLVVCEYGPAGNIRGLYPYIKGDSCTHCPEKYKYCVRKLCSVRPFVGSNARSLHSHSLFEIATRRMLALLVGVGAVMFVWKS